jgi:hypothetical protein
MTRWWSYVDQDFRSEIAVRPRDLTEKVRTLDACLRGAEAEQLTSDESRALQSLLQTVSRLTQASLTGRG